MLYIIFLFSAVVKIIQIYIVFNVTLSPHFYPVHHIQLLLIHSEMLMQPLDLWPLSSIKHEHIAAYKRIN